MLENTEKSAGSVALRINWAAGSDMKTVARQQ